MHGCILLKENMNLKKLDESIALAGMSGVEEYILMVLHEIIMRFCIANPNAF